MPGISFHRAGGGGGTTSPAVLAVPPWVTPFSRCGFGLETRSATASSNASTAWGTANLALYVPVTMDAPFTVRRFGWRNGATVAGTVDAGLLDAAGAKVLSTGAVSQSGTSALQVADVTDTDFPAGRYWLSISCSDATATLMALPLTGAVDGQWLGCAQQSSAHPLPSTATMAAFAASFVPWFGLSTRALA